MKMLLFLFVPLFFASGCGTGRNTEKYTSAEVQSRAVDSIDILYFKKPFTDSSRYTRYYRTVRVSDSTFYHLLENALSGPSVVMEKPKACLSEGKIIIPKGRDAFKVVYFSRSEQEACNYIYVIRNGLFYYHTLSREILTVLNDFERKAEDVE
ncbi:MAG TPA: hypothetical protein VLA58_04100 [Chitinophagaceae bacterium]|nr:hypothetical protein [Chitinophagaceae bacterium]